MVVLSMRRAISIIKYLRAFHPIINPSRCFRRNFFQLESLMIINWYRFFGKLTREFLTLDIENAFLYCRCTFQYLRNEIKINNCAFLDFFFYYTKVLLPKKRKLILITQINLKRKRIYFCFLFKLDIM